MLRSILKTLVLYLLVVIIPILLQAWTWHCLVGSTRKKKGFSIGKAKVLGSNEDQIEGEDGFPIKGPKLWERQIDFEIPEEVESVLAAAEEAEFELIGELSVKLHQNVVAKLKLK